MCNLFRNNIRYKYEKKKEKIENAINSLKLQNMGAIVRGFSSRFVVYYYGAETFFFFIYSEIPRLFRFPSNS